MIELQNERFSASIDPEGGWLVSFSDNEGDILFPRSQITYPDGTVKTRGGSHVCLPNFGPDAEFGMDQHGFGRISEWKIESQSESSVTLLLQGGTEQYKDLSSRLTYELKSTGLQMNLDLYNNGSQSLPVAPGFHPYFQTRAEDTFIVVDGSELAFSDLSEMKLVESEGRELWLAGRRLKLTSSMKHWAHWTDRVDEYICVEPTVRGNAFLDGSYDLLAPYTRYQTDLCVDIL